MKWRGRRMSTNVEDRREETRPVGASGIRGFDVRESYERTLTSAATPKPRTKPKAEAPKPRPKPKAFKKGGKVKK